MTFLRASEIFNDPGRRLIAIESVDFVYHKPGSACVLYAKVEPVALIVCAPDSRCALDMQARPIALDQLRRNMPELDAIMAPFDRDTN